MGADHIDIEKGEEEVASGVSGRLYTVFALLSMLVAGFAASILFGVLGWNPAVGFACDIGYFLFYGRMTGSRWPWEYW